MAYKAKLDTKCLTAGCPNRATTGVFTATHKLWGRFCAKCAKRVVEERNKVEAGLR